MHNDLSKSLLQIPLPVLALIGVIFLGSIWAWFHMRQQSRLAIAAIDDLKNAWRGIQPLTRNERSAGLSTRRMETLQEACKGLAGRAQDWWLAVDDHLEPYVVRDDETGWFLTAPLAEVLTEDATTLSIYREDFHQSVPGIITGAGLLTTFIAILLGLLDVQVQGQTVLGIAGLVNGLSGKFLSSVIALILSILFVIAEKKYCSTLVHNAYEDLIRTGRTLFPQLNVTRILGGLQQEAVKQSTSLSNISSDLVDRFTSAFNEEIVPAFGGVVSEGMAQRLQEEFRPTLQQMSGTLEGLRTAIERLQAQQQESVVHEIQGLVENLQSALVKSLDDMSRQFREALTGAAKDEFDGMGKTLSGTAQVLGEMNQQFVSLQASMRQLIEKAEESATNQVNTGREQVEAMTALMNGLMTRLQQSADSNVRNISDQLTAVVADLNQKVGGLSEQMVAAINDTAQRTQQTTDNLVEKTGAWSEATARRLEELVAAIGHRSDEFKQAGQVLMQAHQALQQTIVQNDRALTSLADAARQVQTYSTALAGQGKSLQQSEERHLQTVAMAKETSGQFSRLLEEQNQVLNRYDRTIQEYGRHFASLDTMLNQTFAAINKGMQDYTTATEKNFGAIVKTVDTVLPKIAMTLKGQVEALEEQLEQLGQILNDGIEGLNGKKKR